jgi:hypothetical protein
MQPAMFTTTMPPTQRSHQPSPKFTPFPRLPIEIPQWTWHLTLEPWVVEITFDDNNGFGSGTARPDTLEVNRDSLARFIKSYPLCFESSWQYINL